MDEYCVVRDVVVLEDEILLFDVFYEVVLMLEICLFEILQVLFDEERWLIEEVDLNWCFQQCLVDELGIMLMVFKLCLFCVWKYLKKMMMEFCQVEVDDVFFVCCYKKMD